MTPTDLIKPCPSTPETGASSREIGRFGPCRAGEEGPVLVLLGGVHGNEPAGIHAARRVLGSLRADPPGSFRGTLVALAGNVGALRSPPGTRYIDRDLNRSFTPELLATPDPGCAECAEARAILDAIGREHDAGRPMFVVDMHTTSAPSDPIVVLEDSLPARRFGRAFGPALLLGFEEEVDGLLIDHLTRTLGCVACVIEGGQHEDPASVDALESAVWVALAAAGIISRADIPAAHRGALARAAGHRAGRVYDLRHRELIVDPSFEMRDGFDAHTPVRAGQSIATHGDGPVRAPVRGELFLPNRQPVKRPGDDAFFIVREVSPGWLDLSAWLRRSGPLRSLIGILPGVHRVAGRPDALLIDGQVAAVLKRQVFHLFGYRIVRRGDEPRVPRFRPWGAVRGFLSAAWHARSPTGEGDRRFWLVARRTLDIAAERSGPRAR